MKVLAALFSGGLAVLMLAVLFSETYFGLSVRAQMTMSAVAFVCVGFGMWLYLAKFPPPTPWRTVLAGAIVGGLTAVVLAYAHDALLPPVMRSGGFSLAAVGAGLTFGALFGVLSIPGVRIASARGRLDAFDRALLFFSTTGVALAVPFSVFQARVGLARGYESHALLALAMGGLVAVIVRERRRKSWLAQWTIEEAGPRDEALPLYVHSGDEVLVAKPSGEGGPFREARGERLARIDRGAVATMMRGRLLLAGGTLAIAFACVPLLAMRRAYTIEHRRRLPEPQPTVVEGLPLAGARGLYVGTDYACVHGADGWLTCWGNTAGPITGKSELSGIWTPTRIAEVGPVAAVAAGVERICVLTAIPSRPLCWGENGPAARSAIGPPNAIALALRGDTTYALTEDGRVWSWVVDAPNTPGPVEGLADIASIAAGEEHACAIDRKRDLFCWGKSYEGGVSGFVRRPTRVASLVEKIALGPHSTWAFADGHWRSWGAEWERGYFSAPDGAVEIVHTEAYLCARRDNGAVECFTAYPAGEESPRYTMAGLPPGNTRAIAGSPNQVCALGDQVRCWGTRISPDP